MRKLKKKKKRKSRKTVIIALVSVVILGVSMISICLPKNKKTSQVPNDYLAVFQGGSGEITHSTYIYKLDNGKKDCGYKYINTTNITKSWGSSDCDVNKTEEGTVVYVKDIFQIAKENNAYSYVTLPGDSKTYTVEEYEEITTSN